MPDLLNWVILFHLFRVPGITNQFSTKNMRICNHNINKAKLLY